MISGPLPNGNFVTNGYGYDARNRLTSAGGSTYRYNPDGLRVQVTGTGAATYVIDPNAVHSRALIRVVGSTTTFYVYGLGLLYEDTNGSTLSYHFNQVGSTLALTDDSQNVTDKVRYSPFGTITEHTGTSTTPFLFNGAFGVMTDSNGLCYMRARYYNPRLMRFVNADPSGFGGGLNWYAFCSNNPVSNTDPFGLCRQAPNLVDVPDPWNPLSWSWDEWVDAANAAKAGVGDPIGTAAGLMIYGDVPGTVKIGAGAGYGGYVEIGRSGNGTYTITGAGGWGAGAEFTVSTDSPTNDIIVGHGLSFGDVITADGHAGPVAVSGQLSTKNSFDIKGNYSLDLFKLETQLGLEGTKLSVGGQWGPTVKGNLGDSSSRFSVPIEPKASFGLGGMLFMGVHVGYSF
jgi:RHS repeat-associated protein